MTREVLWALAPMVLRALCAALWAVEHAVQARRAWRGGAPRWMALVAPWAWSAKSDRRAAGRYLAAATGYAVSSFV